MAKNNSLFERVCEEKELLTKFQQLLGHKNISTISGFYVFATLDVLAKAMETVNPDDGVKNWSNPDTLEHLYRLQLKTMPKFLRESYDSWLNDYQPGSMIKARDILLFENFHNASDQCEQEPPVWAAFCFG